MGLALLLIRGMVLPNDGELAVEELAVLLSACALAVALGLGMAVLRQVSLFTRALEDRGLARCEVTAESLPSVPGALTDVARLVDRLVFDIRHGAERAAALADDQAHALRTPLSTIKVAMPVISRNVPADDPRVARAIDAIEKSIERMIVTVDRGRREARAIAALLGGARSRVELDAVVNQAVDEAHEEALSRDVRIVSSSDGAAIVAVNFEALAIALTEILLSAVDASADHSDIEIRISSYDGIASIAVQDSARDAADPAALFESGLEDKPSRDTGRWPGLYKEQRTVEAHGGTLSACRNALGGLTVTMTLPI